MAHQLPPPTLSAEPRPKHMSSPIELHGVDITALDARDVCIGMAGELSPLPTDPDRLRTARDPIVDPDGAGGPSFSPRHSPSLSAGRITDDGTVSHFDPPSDSRSRSVSTWIYPYRHAPGSSPALSVRVKDNDDGASAPIPVVPSFDPTQAPATAPHPNPTSVPSSTSNSTLNSTSSKTKPNKKRLPVLGRSKSLRAEDQLNEAIDSKSKSKGSTPKRSNHGAHSKSTPAAEMSEFIRPENQRKFMGIMRDRSQDRTEPEASTKSKGKKDKSKEREGALSSNYKANNTSAFFTDFRQSSSRATDGITKAGKGFFNKFTRSGSNHEKSAPTVPEDYVVRILTLPLIEQTRRTRIAKSYDHCKDKTEFWMPALPWRCIDFLNGKCEEEGLYRISGGITKVKEWRIRFDTELDVNLLDETELYDASIIASLFKEWIRELPEEIFPKEAQARVTAQLDPEVRDPSIVAGVLRRELQTLPPFNYYLLFAITCHLSLLLEYESKNKMNLENLYRCFNQSLRLEGRIFYALVGCWRQCWAGCLTENEYLKAEYDHLQHPYPQFIQDSMANGARFDERAISSSDSSAPPTNGVFTPEVQRPATSHTLLSHTTSEGEEPWITPVKKSKRSSSDVTGLSPMRFNASPLHRG